MIEVGASSTFHISRAEPCGCGLYPIDAPQGRLLLQCFDGELVHHPAELVHDRQEETRADAPRVYLRVRS